MPREALPLKREYKGDVFRNPDIQNDVIKNCKKFKTNKK
jgi:hypothetical protein